MVPAHGEGSDVPSQRDIAQHLDLSQPRVHQLMRSLGLEDYADRPLEQIRVAYIRNLRAQAAGHRSADGTDLTYERVLSERQQREINAVKLAQMTGALVPRNEVGPTWDSLVVAARTELLSLKDRVVAEIRTAHGIDIDPELVDCHVRRALERLARDEDDAAHDAPASDETVGAAA